MTGDLRLPDLTRDRPLCLLVRAVHAATAARLVDWLVALAQQQTWTVAASIRTEAGVSIGYVEMMPARQQGLPVLTPEPVPGDVDVVIADEFAEAGRAVLAGLVTPERTLLIASTDRVHLPAEASAVDEAIIDPAVILDAVEFAARRLVAFNFQALTAREGGAPAAALFGALAATGILPVPREDFALAAGLDATPQEGVGNAFLAGFDRALRPGRPKVDRLTPAHPETLPESHRDPELSRLITRIRADLPLLAHDVAYAGILRLADYQDAAYAEDYLLRLIDSVARDKLAGGDTRNWRFSLAVARRLAVAMSYEDSARIADLKIRSERFRRLVGDGGHDIVDILQPRLFDLPDVLPARLGRFFQRHPRIGSWLSARIGTGRRVVTTRLGGFLKLWGVAMTARLRRGSLRHQTEMAEIADWMRGAHNILPDNYQAAVELVEARALVAGHGDSRARGRDRFARILAATPALASRSDAGDWLRRLRLAAVADESGAALTGALETVAALDQPA